MFVSFQTGWPQDPFDHLQSLIFKISPPFSSLPPQLPEKKTDKTFLKIFHPLKILSPSISWAHFQSPGPIFNLPGPFSMRFLPGPSSLSSNPNTRFASEFLFPDDLFHGEKFWTKAIIFQNQNRRIAIKEAAKNASRKTNVCWNNVVKNVFIFSERISP